MTNEAIRILKLAIEDSKEHISFCFDSRGIEALNMAIKALEQQPILDKIRAEIKALSGDIETIADVLAIIDKYKAESEDKE